MTPLWRVRISTSAEGEEAIVPLCEELLGQTPSIYTDVDTGEVSATVFLRKPRPKKEVQSSIRAAFERLRSYGIDPGPGTVSMTKVRKQDWAESWKRHFKPFVAGAHAALSSLLVKPSWSRRKPARGQSTIVIDPGLSFGTGQHATTRFCLEQLVAARVPAARQSLLDVGTGSGILAIAAAKMGYNPVRGFDFDSAAVRIAKENARANRVQISIARGDILKMRRATRQYDVVCANLTADLLEACATKLIAAVKPGGLLILAGILRTQISSVRQCFQRRGWMMAAEKNEGEWASMALQRLDD